MDKFYFSSAMNATKSKIAYGDVYNHKSDMSEVFIKDYEKLVYVVINDLPYVHQNAEYEDLVQVGMTALWKAIEEYNKSHHPCKLSTFCYRAIKNDILNWLEKFNAKKRKNIPIDSQTYISNFEDEVIGNQIIYEMRKYLSQKDLNLFVDRYVTDLSLRQLKEKYNLSEKTISRRLSKSKNILKTNMKWEIG